jgi:iron-sulfur cluster repair protein YtfE (RIC family)
LPEEIIQDDGTLIMPRAPGSDKPAVRLNFSKIYATLGRIEEVATVTSMKAPELMSAFNRAYLDLGRWASVVLYEKAMAKADLDGIFSRIVLETAPRILQEKKIRESDVTRQAVADQDPDYKKARDILDKLTALHEVMKHQLKSIEMAYTSAKKVLGEHNPNLVDMRKELNGMPDESEQPFGVAKY